MPVRPLSNSRQFWSANVELRSHLSYLAEPTAAMGSLEYSFASNLHAMPINSCQECARLKLVSLASRMLHNTEVS